MFAKGVGTTAGGEVCRPLEVNVPVQLNSPHYEAWINPGDYIVGDLNGVVCVPSKLARDVLDAVPKIVEADERCAVGIRAGRTVAEVFKEFHGK